MKSALLLAGNALVDIARLITLGAAVDERKELEPILLKLYHETLTKLMAEEGKRLEFSLEQVRVRGAGC